MVNKKRIPDRWKDYKPCSWTPIGNERIISFKTPLSENFVTQMEGDEGLVHSERFTPSDVLSELNKRDLRLGMVLDFTFTKRYYNPKEFTDNGIIYKKMMCPGHQIPKEEAVKRFENEVYSFLENDKTGALVGVHCTHGLNRTGYMVCRYLIDCKEYKPEQAIKAFNEARGYPIERENYLEDLESREPGNDVDFSEYQSTRNTPDRDSKQERNFRTREGANSQTDPPHMYGQHAWNDLYHRPRHTDRHSTSQHQYSRASSHGKPHWNNNYDLNRVDFSEYQSTRNTPDSDSKQERNFRTREGANSQTVPQHSGKVNSRKRFAEDHRTDSNEQDYRPHMYGQHACNDPYHRPRHTDRYSTSQHPYSRASSHARPHCNDNHDLNRGSYDDYDRRMVYKRRYGDHNSHRHGNNSPTEQDRYQHNYNEQRTLDLQYSNTDTSQPSMSRAMHEQQRYHGNSGPAKREYRFLS